MKDDADANLKLPPPSIALDDKPMEIELKLALDPHHVARLKRHPLLAAGKPTRQDLHSIYFDTPDFALTQRKIALRVRRVGYHWVQTLKVAAPAVGALSTRPEWEAQVMDNTPDLSVLAAEARELLADFDLSALGPVFVTDIKRTTWLVRVGETAMEIALDQGEIRALNQSTAAASPVSEIELELKGGPADGLFSAALELLERTPLRIDSRSKSAIGFRLAGAVKPRPVKAAWPILEAKQPAGATWTHLVQVALSQLVDNLPGFLEAAEDIEYLHQVRVAMRRLISLARLYPQADPIWLDALRGHMTILNPARDWDVFLEETLPRLGLPDDPSFQAHLTDLAAQARQAAQSCLASAAFTHTVLTLGQSLLRLPDGALDTASWAEQVLDRRWKGIKRRGAALVAGDAIARHRLRIAVKKLRYATDALANLYGRRAKPSLADLQALQDSLGVLNDLQVAQRLMHALALAHPESAFSAGQVVGLLRAETARHIDPDRRVLAELAAFKPFWRPRRG